MALVVQKYGGTSVADVDKIRHVARRVARKRAKGNDIVVVVSAMAGETDRLIKLAHLISKRPSPREYDALVSTGENITGALLALALNERRCPAVSLQGHQVRILTDTAHRAARIEGIDVRRIREQHARGEVVVVAGFQGITAEGDITTLGRGGSDTTAVALAAALDADLCEIYTDVDGVYTADPNVCPRARKIRRIAYDEMLELASLGAKVLQLRSVEFAKNYRVPLEVRSTFTNTRGTRVDEEVPDMEKVNVRGVAHDKNQAKVTINAVPDQPGVAAKVFSAIAAEGINVDMIIQNVSRDGRSDITFTVPRTDIAESMRVIRAVAKDVGARSTSGDENVAKVSIVGVGMRSHFGVAAKMFSCLADEGINIQMISTSEIKVSCVIEEKYCELAVKTLHSAFGLDGKVRDEAAAAGSEPGA